MLIKINFVTFLIKTQNFFLNFLQKIIWPSPISDVNEILIYKIGNIGDIIAAYPSLQIIRKKYPSARITFLTSPGSNQLKTAAKIFIDQGLVDEILYYYDGKIFTHFKKIRSLKIDLCFAMSDDKASFFKELRNMLFFSTLNIKSTIGFQINRINCFEKAFAEKIPYPYKNEVDRNIEMLNLTKDNNTIFFKYENFDISEKIHTVIKKARNPLIIALGAKIESKKWGLNNFLEISKKWIQKEGDIIIIGGKEDFDDTTLLIQKLIKWKKKGIYDFDEKRIFNLCSTTSINESIFLIDNSSVLLSNDSGPAHLSSFTQTKVVTIQAPRDFQYKWDPYFSKDFVIRPKYPKICNCKKNECGFCVIKISVNEVWSKIKVFN